jgi:hypothetical protein
MDAYAMDESTYIETGVVEPDAGDTVDAESESSADAPQGPLCCKDGQNAINTTDESCWHELDVAWEYIPNCNLLATQIALHDTGGPIAILDSVGTFPAVSPGAVLWTGTLPSSTTASWTSVDILPPLPLTAGHSYFIQEGLGTCSIALAGDEWPSFTLGSSGWVGPSLMFAWASRITGNCNGVAW